jgi:Nucleoporin Nup120/160
MSATRLPHLLVASHISAAFGPPRHVQVPTSRQATNTVQHTAETLENHAIYASICADDRVGNVLLRIVNGGYHLELTLLDSDDEPTRFEFPERILPMPAVVPSHLNQMSAEVLALTCDGTLYRLVYPLEGRQFHETPVKEWCTQSSIYSSIPRPLRGIALVHNKETVVITLENGALLRIDWQGATQRG